MSRGNGSQNEMSDRNNGVNSSLNMNRIHNRTNNNHDEYNLDMRANKSEKIAEDDPLTGHRKWDANEPLKPSCADKFASTHFFMVIFLLAYVLQGCYFTYFVSVITTIEKLFHIKSATIALLLNFSEIGQICTSLLLTYTAGRGHRPRWIACGMLLFSIAAFGSVSPHFIFGSRLYSQGVSVKSPENQAWSSGDFSVLPANPAFIESVESLCLTDEAFRNLSASDPTCNENMDQDSNNKMKSVVLVILAVSLLGIGIGQTAISVLGIPYIDDNVQSKQSPMYMAITIGVRVLGPAIGYYIGSFCIRQYVDLTRNVDPSDPNFIGAWWLGLLLVSTSMFFASFVMFTFPRNLRNKSTQVMPTPTTKLDESLKTEKGRTESDDSDAAGSGGILSQFRDFTTTVKRQLKNDILMFRTASAVLHLLPITGLYVFLPKYLENQFQMATHNANFISGTFGILMMGAGIIITGIMSVKYRVSARHVSLWIAFTALATAIGMMVLSMIGCPMDNFKGLETRNDGGIGSSKFFVPPCGNLNSSCLCDDTIYSPICGSDGLSYFSACHAGCKFESEKNGRRNFSDCSCDDFTDSVPEMTAKSGLCDDGRCDTKLHIFVAIFALTVFIHSTSEVGGMMIIMRCTHPKDKSMAMGIVQFSLGLFANIPCPNIYARIIDATCIVWTKICGQNGHCSLYDSDSFRTYYFGVTSFIMMLAFCVDMVVYFKSHRIDIDPESHSEATRNKTQDHGNENLLELRKLSHNGASREEA